MISPAITLMAPQAEDSMRISQKIKEFNLQANNALEQGPLSVSTIKLAGLNKERQQLAVELKTRFPNLDVENVLTDISKKQNVEDTQDLLSKKLFDSAENVEQKGQYMKRFQDFDPTLFGKVDMAVSGEQFKSDLEVFKERKKLGTATKAEDAYILSALNAQQGAGDKYTIPVDTERAISEFITLKSPTEQEKVIEFVPKKNISEFVKLDSSVDVTPKLWGNAREIREEKTKLLGKGRSLANRKTEQLDFYTEKLQKLNPEEYKRF
jgi:hypothetical protein